MPLIRWCRQTWTYGHKRLMKKICLDFFQLLFLLLAHLEASRGWKQYWAKISTCFPRTVFCDSVPVYGTMKNTIPVLEQAFCQRQSSVAEPLHQWRKARKLNSDSEPSATNKNIKELDFATVKMEFNLKLSRINWQTHCKPVVFPLEIITQHSARTVFIISQSEMQH